MKRLLIYGASYPGTLKIIDAINRQEPLYEVVGYIDDVKFGVQNEFMGHPIVGDAKALDEWSQRDVVVLNNVYSTTSGRKKVAQRIANANLTVIGLVHPGLDTKYVSIGQGCLIMAGVDLGVNSVLDDHSAVKMNSVISHDCRLGEYVFVGPGAVICGHVVIEEGAYIGAGAVIKERTRIGAWATIGMGACVIKDVGHGETVVGNPARKILLNEV